MSNQNLFTEFPFNEKASMEKNFTDCIQHFGGIIDQLAEGDHINGQATIELYHHLKIMKDQKWFIKQTNPKLYQERYVRRTSGNDAEAERLAQDRRKFCKCCGKLYADIQGHFKTDLHKRNRKNLLIQKLAVNGHHDTKKHYKKGHLYKVNHVKTFMIYSNAMEKYLKRKLDLKKSFSVIQRYWRGYWVRKNMPNLFPPEPEEPEVCEVCEDEE